MLCDDWGTPPSRETIQEREIEKFKREIEKLKCQNRELLAEIDMFKNQPYRKVWNSIVDSEITPVILLVLAGIAFVSLIVYGLTSVDGAAITRTETECARLGELLEVKTTYSRDVGACLYKNPETNKLVTIDYKSVREDGK